MKKPERPPDFIFEDFLYFYFDEMIDFDVRDESICNLKITKDKVFGTIFGEEFTEYRPELSSVVIKKYKEWDFDKEMKKLLDN